MPRLLVFSFSGFSDLNANGKTLKTLLQRFACDELAQFYCGNEPEDFAFCTRYFHVTDGAMLHSLFGKKPAAVRNAPITQKEPSQADSVQGVNKILPDFLKKNNYNFLFRYGRELLWSIAPWGKKELENWIDAFAPDAIFYMVGESWFMDRLVMKTVQQYNIPLILYNAEAYRLVDEKKRYGLERLFYRRVKRSYKRLHGEASFVVYNCRALLDAYRKEYGPDRDCDVYYNAAPLKHTPYAPSGDAPALVYFGNLGVGRVGSLLEIAQMTKSINPNSFLHVYGKANEKEQELLNAHPQIVYHGLVAPKMLYEIEERADVLVHTESFDPLIAPKLRFAFSTKIAQYLAAGRCVLTYAPAETASTQYFAAENCALVADSTESLFECLSIVLTDDTRRSRLAAKALQVARRNHDCDAISLKLKNKIEEIIHEV